MVQDTHFTPKHDTNAGITGELDLFAGAGGLEPAALEAHRDVVPTGQTVFIDFDGGQIAVVLVDSEPNPILRLASDSLNLKWSGQHEKLQSDPAICVREIRTQLPGDSQARVVLTTDLDGFSLWLAKINANKVAAGARDLVITWQRKAARAIRERFFGKPAHSATVDLSSLDGIAIVLQAAQESYRQLLAERQRSGVLMTAVKELAPAAQAWDTLIATGRSWDVGFVAKRLTEKGATRCGRNLLYAKLRELGWVFKNTQEPRQEAVDQDFVKPEDEGTRIDKATGNEVENKPRTRIRPKGALFLADVYGVSLTPDEVEQWVAERVLRIPASREPDLHLENTGPGS